MTSVAGTSGSAFRVGQHVVVDMGTQTERGVLLEDRGALDVGGGRVWRLRIAGDEREQREIEVPERRLRPAQSNATLRAIALGPSGEVTSSGTDAEILLRPQDLDALQAHDWGTPMIITAQVITTPANSVARHYPLLEAEGSHFRDVEVIDPPPPASGSRAAVPPMGRIRIRVREAVQHW